MVWWIVAMQIISFLASTYSIIRYLSTPFESPKASGLSDFSIPTADASRAIPVVFGTVKITGPNVVWYGDYGNFGWTTEGSKGDVAGYYYFLGMDMALCMGPVDVVHACTFEEKSGGFTNIFDSNDMGTWVVENIELWGGKKSGGGLRGEIDIYYGTGIQVSSPYVVSRAGADYPANRHVCHAVFRNRNNEDSEVPGAFYYGGFYWGTQPYIKPVAITVERCPNTLSLPWGLHYTSFDAPGWGHDSNPACIIYDILTNAIWGLGLSTDLIDTASFYAAGLVLAGEEFGMSMMLENQGAANELIADILRHVDAEIYADPETGKLVFKLVRALSVGELADLPVFDESNLSNVEFTRGSWSETFNTVKVAFVSRFDNFTERIAQWQNLSNIQGRGGEQSVLQVDFQGVATAGPAAQIAARLLKGASYPFAKLRLFANRQAWRLRPGDAIKVSWPPLGIVNMVCRVVRPASGELVEGTISLDVVEDTFTLAGTGFTDPGPSEWVDPMVPPVAATQQLLVEVPYQIVGAAERHVAALAARPALGISGYKIWSDAAGGTAYVETNSVSAFVPTGVLAAAWAQNTAALDTTGFSVTDLLDASGLASISSADLYLGVNLALIDSEIVAWQTISAVSGTRTISNVLRGVLDTVPAYHASGARVWFLTNGPSENWTNPTVPYAADGTIAAKLLPFTQHAVLPIADATRLTVALASRCLKPLPPGRVRLASALYPGGSAWPDAIILTDPGVTGVDVVVTWAHRHRLNQAADGVIVSQDGTDYAASPEGNYTIKVWVDGVLKRTVTAVTGATWTWTVAMQTADGANIYSMNAVISITPVNGSLSGTPQVRGFLL